MNVKSSEAQAAALLTPEPCVSRVGKFCTSSMNLQHLVRSGINALRTDGEEKPHGVHRNVQRPVPASAAQLAERLFDDVGEKFTGTVDWGRHTQLCSSPRVSQQKVNDFLRAVETDRKAKFEQELSPKKYPEGKGYDDGSISKHAPPSDGRHRKYFKKTPKPIVSPTGLMSSKSERFVNEDRLKKAPPPGNYKPRYNAIEKEMKGPSMSRHGFIDRRTASPRSPTRDRSEECFVKSPRSPRITISSAGTSGGAKIRPTVGGKALPSIPFRQRENASRLGPKEDPAIHASFNWPRQEPLKRTAEPLLWSRMVGRRAQTSMGTNKISPDVVYEGAQCAPLYFGHNASSLTRFDQQIPRRDFTVKPSTVATYNTSALEGLKFRRTVRNVTSFIPQNHKSRKRQDPLPSAQVNEVDGEDDLSECPNELPVVDKSKSYAKGNVSFLRMVSRRSERPLTVNLQYDVDMSLTQHSVHVGVDFQKCLARKPLLLTETLSSAGGVGAGGHSDKSALGRHSRNINLEKMLGRQQKESDPEYKHAIYETDKPKEIRGIVPMGSTLGRAERKTHVELYKTQIQQFDHTKANKAFGSRIKGEGFHFDRLITRDTEPIHRGLHNRSVYGGNMGGL